jgi:predicted DNA-binding protein with PD1-like motif
VHSHLTLSYVDNETIRVIGGHMIEGCIVHGFAEIILMELVDVEMVKEYDEETKTIQLFS